MINTMKKHSFYRACAVGFFGLFALAQAATLHLGLSKVVDTNTTMPGSGKHYEQLGLPTYHDGRIVFAGSASLFVNGLYDNIPGYVQLVADNQTHLPLSKTTFFSNFFSHQELAGLPSMNKGQIVFYAESAGQAGLYRLRQDHLSVIANAQTMFPSSQQSFDYLAYPSLLASGQVVFVGGSGVSYGVFVADNQGKLQRLMSVNDTPIPQGKGRFEKILSLAISPTNRATDYAFVGAGDKGQMGVYVTHQQSLIRVVNRKMKMPGGVGFFSHFSHVVDAGHSVGFIADGLLGEEGIYVYNERGLLKIATTNDLVPLGQGKFFHFDGLAMSGNQLIFQATGESGEQGLYLYVPIDGLFKVLSKGDKINGKTIQRVSVGPKSFEGNHVAMRVAFEDGTIAEYIATLTLGEY